MVQRHDRAQERESRTTRMHSQIDGQQSAVTRSCAGFRYELRLIKSLVQASEMWRRIRLLAMGIKEAGVSLNVSTTRVFTLSPKHHCDYHHRRHL
ncbi:hypothetical protein AB1N83_014272 [Pleurotus pulmonarius]